MKTFFRHFIIMKICIDSTFIRPYFSFCIFFIVHQFASISILLTWSQILLYFLKHWSSLIMKFHLFSFIKIFYTSAHFPKHYTKWLRLFIIFLSNKIFTIFLPEGTFLNIIFFQYLHRLCEFCIENSEIYICQSQYYEISKFLYSFFICLHIYTKQKIIFLWSYFSCILMWYSKTRVTSFKLRVTSWKLKSTS